jgi:Secretion system C-terminal sorting domain/NHL repeat
MNIFCTRIILIFFFILITNNCLLKAQNISTFAGSGFNGNTGNNAGAVCAGIPYTRGVCWDGDEFIYITCSNSIRKIRISTGTIINVAGSDSWGYSGDGGPASNALLQFPSAVAFDKNGNLYITEYGGHRVRKINVATGIISTFGGTSTAGYSGDGGPATAASLNTPNGICVDPEGNVYVADFKNSRIRKINTVTGIITTFAGNGSTNYSGDNGLAINAGTPYPTGLASDKDGNIFIVEVASAVTSRIRKVNSSTGIITTVAGNGLYQHSGDGGLAVNAGLFGPSGVVIDSAGNIYISQYDDSRIRKVNASTGIINTIAGTGINAFSGDGGLAISATLHYPIGLCMDKNKNLYIADNTNHRIRRIGNAPVSPNTGTSITISPDTIVVTPNCSNNTVLLKANIINGGNSPFYQWKKNGIPIGNNTPTLTLDSYTSGDTINCIISGTICNSQFNITSNKTVITGFQNNEPITSIIWQPSSSTVDNSLFNVFLKWQTEFERSTSKFEILISNDSINFTTVKTIPANGNSTLPVQYNTNITNLIKGKYYFRIKALTTDCRPFESSIISIVLDKGCKGNLSAVPNPVQSILKIKIPSCEKGDIKIINTVGKVINIIKASDQSEIEINCTGLPAGMYYVEFSGVKKHYTKFIKL